MMSDERKHAKPSNQRLPILARHAVSLGMVFVLAIVLSYFVGLAVNRNIQLSKLDAADQATFEEGLGFVAKHAGTSSSVNSAALTKVQDLQDPQRAADLLLAIAKSHADRDDIVIPEAVYDSIASLMQRLDTLQAIGLYDGLTQINGIDPIRPAEDLLANLAPADDTELLKVVDLLDARGLWSKHSIPLNLWVRWLNVLTTSDAKLTQFVAGKNLGDLPEAADDPRVTEALRTLASSQHEEVRNKVLDVAAGYAAIANDPTDYEQIIFQFGQDENKYIARRAWIIVGHLKPLSGFAVNWRDTDTFVAEAMLWAALKTNPENNKPAIRAMKTHGYEAAGALALNEWQRPPTPVSDADLVIQKLLETKDERELKVAWRSILASKDYMFAEAGVIAPFGYEQIKDEQLAELHLAGNWAASILAPKYDPSYQYSEAALTAYLEGIFDHDRHAHDAIRLLKVEPNWPIYARLLAAAHGIRGIDLDQLIGELPLDRPVLLDLFTLALTHAEEDDIDRYIRSLHPQMVTMAATASVIRGYQPMLIDGVNEEFLRQNPDFDTEAARKLPDSELETLGLTRIDALPALLEAAQAAPPVANRGAESKLLQLALWMRGDLDEGFTPIAEGMLFDDDLPTSTVLMCLLHKQRPIALDYLFGDLTRRRPNLNELFIQKRYWHVFRRFVDTPDLNLWLWGDPEAQAFQFEVIRQWYAVNRWKIKQGWWPAPTNDR